MVLPAAAKKGSVNLHFDEALRLLRVQRPPNMVSAQQALDMLAKAGAKGAKGELCCLCVESNKPGQAAAHGPGPASAAVCLAEQMLQPCRCRGCWQQRYTIFQTDGRSTDCVAGLCLTSQVLQGGRLGKE
jgi:hypothetical protein